MHRSIRRCFWLSSMFIVLFSCQNLYAEQSSKPLVWAGCGITKKAFMAELAKAYQRKTGINIILQDGGATRGIRDTVARKIDIGGSCRLTLTLPSENHRELYAQLQPVAWDVLAVIAHPNNLLKNVTTQQIHTIYEGKIRNWKQLGLNNAPIHLYIRRGRISGVGYAIRQYIFQDSGKVFVTDKKYVMRSSRPPEKAVETDPDALAITGISSARKRHVSILSFDGKSPSYENVRDGKYVWYRPLYLVTNPGPIPAV